MDDVTESRLDQQMISIYEWEVKNNIFAVHTGDTIDAAAGMDTLTLILKWPCENKGLLKYSCWYSNNS